MLVFFKCVHVIRHPVESILNTLLDNAVDKHIAFTDKTKKIDTVNMFLYI